MRLFVFVLGCLSLVAGCTIDVQTGKPDITVDCVLVELPGGEVRTDCDAGIQGDAADGSADSAAPADGP